jgi:hypothetical protein
VVVKGKIKTQWGGCLKITFKHQVKLLIKSTNGIQVGSGRTFFDPPPPPSILVGYSKKGN